METNEWVRAARKHANLTQEQLGEQMGVTKGNVSGWENSRHSPSFEQMRRISEVTGLSLPTGEAGAAPRAADEQPEYAGRARDARKIPVLGTARLGEDGFYELTEGEGFLSAISDDPHAYGLRVKGQSMHPAIRHGWYVLVEPSCSPSQGEYVLIQLQEGQKMVKELMYRRTDSIEVTSVNDGSRLTFDLWDLDRERGIQAIGAVIPPSKWHPA